MPFKQHLKAAKEKEKQRLVDHHYLCFATWFIGKFVSAWATLCGQAENTAEQQGLGTPPSLSISEMEGPYIISFTISMIT